MEKNEKAPLVFTYFMLVKTSTNWLKLQPRERFAFLDETIKPILKKYPTVRMRFFDAEAFTAKASDVIMWETDNQRDYTKLIDALRESLFWSVYFEVLEIIPAVENSYAANYEVEAY
jgi:hypothetical protein